MKQGTLLTAVGKLLNSVKMTFTSDARSLTSWPYRHSWLWSLCLLCDQTEEKFFTMYTIIFQVDLHGVKCHCCILATHRITWEIFKNPSAQPISPAQQNQNLCGWNLWWRPLFESNSIILYMISARVIKTICVFSLKIYPPFSVLSCASCLKNPTSNPVRVLYLHSYPTSLLKIVDWIII